MRMHPAAVAAAFLFVACGVLLGIGISSTRTPSIAVEGSPQAGSRNNDPQSATLPPPIDVVQRGQDPSEPDPWRDGASQDGPGRVDTSRGGPSLGTPALSEMGAGVDGESFLTAEERRNIAVYDHCYRSVVHVSTQAVQVDRFFRVATQEEGSGSGSVLDGQGHILTNFHVIDGANRLTVTLFNGKQFEAELVGQDPPNDMAVLKIDAPPEMLFPVNLGESASLRVGQKVYAIGSPFGLDRSMSVGVVSSLGRSVPTHNHRVLKSMIQVDAALNQGNSGGPLLDSGGRLVGMNTAIATTTGANTGVGFAIPVDTIRRVATLLIRDGRVIRPSLGIAAYLQSPDGLVVGQLVPGGPAEQAGMRGVRVIRRRTYFGERRELDIDYADTIIAVEGQPVRTLDDLMSVIETMKPGEVARLSVLRDGQAASVHVTLGEDADP